MLAYRYIVLGLAMNSVALFVAATVFASRLQAVDAICVFVSLTLFRIFFTFIGAKAGDMSS